MAKEYDECEEYAAVISALPDMVFVLTESGRYAAIFGGENPDLYHEGSALKGLTLANVLPEDKANWFKERIKETLDADCVKVFEYSLSANDIETMDAKSGPAGEQRFEGRVNPLKSLRYGERAVVWVARNITVRHQIEQQLLYQSEVDDLSKTLNRRKFFENLNDAFYAFKRYHENYCFLMVDIDNFKRINDSYGHCLGDEAIRKVADICKLKIRKTDMIGRLGGDEFGIILKHTADIAPVAFAERLIEAVSNTLLHAELSDTRVSISIGLSHFNESDQGMGDIYQRADLALYDAKRRGKNRVSTKLY
ncbi:MAG: diguanylate cyclase [Vibrio sp.]|uniref:sensor domain-containing diguanylate cyclase n=1 Tax=Vibrio sp. TaxID=678 RepID=UPI003A8BACB9